MNKDCIDLLCESPYIVGHELGFKDLTELNNEWIKMMISSEQDETILAHRGSFKTTCLTLAIAIIMILNPVINIIFIRKTDDDVKEVIIQVAKILKSNLVKYLVMQIYGIELVLVEESAFRITTNLMHTTKGSSQLLGLGIKSSMTGKHADLVITDDIVNLKDRISKAERDIIKQAYQELENIKNRGGRILNTGTPWHKEDAITGMPNKHIYDCYQTGLITRDKLEEIRQSMTPSMFAANYELQHIADEECMFSNPVFTSDPTMIYNGSCHIDAAYGGSDCTAFTIIKKDKEGKLYVLGKLFKKHVDECLIQIFAYHSEYRAGSFCCENNADKGYLKKELISKGFVCHGYHEKTNKFIKISSYLKKHWKDIVFLEDTDPEYINQILDYTEHAEHDDAPDSLASAIRRVCSNNWVY